MEEHAVILKEAYRYMNYLDSLLDSAKIYLENPHFITTTKQTHYRTKVNPAAQDEVTQLAKPFDVEICSGKVIQCASTSHAN